MTLIPRTISRSLRDELGKCEYTEESLFQKLSSNPKNLLQFFIQATQNHTWCNHNISLVRRMFSFIYKSVLLEEIPFDHAMRSSAYVIKYNIFAYDLVSYDPVKRSFSGMGMLWAVPKTLSLMREIELKENKQIAPYVDVKEFTALYSTFNLHDFSVFHSLPISSLRGCLLQCKEWDYKEGILEIQKIYILRIFNVLDAFEIYGFSIIHKFTLLKCYCEKIIRNFEWVSYELMGSLIFSSLRKVYTYSVINLGPINFSELAKHRHSVEKSAKYNVGATFDRLDIGFVAVGMVAIALKKMNFVQYLHYSAINKDNPRSLNLNEIKSVTFDRETLLTDDFIVGFCAFCPNIVEISFKSGKEINKRLLNDISLVAPRLKKIVIYEVEHIDKNQLQAISTAFCGLEELTFALINRLDSFDCLDLPKLNRLTIEQCPEIKGESLNRLFSNLKELKIQSTTWGHVKKLVEACPQLEIITIRDVADFDLSRYPHPESIIELNIDSNILALNIVGGRLDCLRLFSKLKILEIIGIPNDPLKKALASIEGDFKIKIVKIINDDKE